MSDDMLRFINSYVCSRILGGWYSPFMLDMVENAIRKTKKRTPALDELLCTWALIEGVEI